jgi:phage-related baseplate assembly protein
VGGGIRGRIGIGKINEQRSVSPLPPSNAAVTVNFRNITASSGGTDKESLEAAKKRAPKDYAVHNSIVTAEDYAQVAGAFAHPAFGSVAKAVATLKSGLNSNRVEIFILSEGPDSVPAIPNAGLKAGLITYYQNLNVLTDHVVISDGVLHPIDVEVTVVVSRDSDATIVKDKVENVITEYFNSSNWNMGQPFYISNFIKIIKDIDGVAYIDLFKPVDNILRSEDLALANTDIDDKISPNELIVEGNRIINYYYEKEL